MKLRQLLLTLPMTAALAPTAAAWQFPPGPRPDPYAQPPVQNDNPGFRFAADPNAPQPPPAFNPPGFAPPPQQPFVPQPQYGPQPTQPVPPQFPQQQPPAGPPPNRTAALPLIPGFDPNEAPAASPGPPGALYQPSQIIATVGNQYILYGDVSPNVEMTIQPVLAKAPPSEHDQIYAVRPRLLQQFARQMVETKILYLEFEREMESKAGRDKLPEIRKDISKRMRESFERDLLKTREKVLTATPDEVQDMARRDAVLPRLAILMKEHEIETLADLDTLLRRYGSSLEKQQRTYMEVNLGRMGIGEKLKTKTEVSHLEMLSYYREHADDFAVKARARFEILTVKFANFPNKDLAKQQIVQMGNDVFYGTPFAAVAKRGSQEPHAEKGGYYDWTNQHSLASDVVDNAVFTLEAGKLSPILEDDKGLHIIRVIERQPAGFIPFTDAQVKIKELINQKRHNAAVKEHLDSLRSKTTVWTIYDADPATNVATQPMGNPQR